MGQERYEAVVTAGVMELVDMRDLGSRGVIPVQVRVLSPAPKWARFSLPKRFFFNRLQTGENGCAAYRRTLITVIFDDVGQGRDPH